MILKREAYYDEVNDEWRCDIDEFTTVIVKHKYEMEDALDQIENYIRINNDTETAVSGGTAYN